jgi:hypothetical protein
MRVHHFELRLLGIVLVASLSFASGAHAACLSKSAAASPTGKQHVIAPNGEVARYQALGYSVEQCDVSLDQLSRSVDTICQMASAAPNAVQARVSSSKGVSLHELCASGKAGLAEMKASTKPP